MKAATDGLEGDDDGGHSAIVARCSTGRRPSACHDDRQPTRDAVDS